MVTSADIRSVKQRLGIVGNSPALLEAVGRALRVAPIDLSVLIIGESGSGKEFFPKIIHSAGARKHAKYIAVNCGAIPEGTIDSELFGHEKGSFTGAVATRKGYFEEADGGTIFLDEVAELPLTTQARLLRVLESGEFLKVGSSQVQHTNIRVVAATNVDLAKAVAEGRFRQDLFYRLSTVQINVPPLRERGDDISLLALSFATAFAERYSTPVVQFSPAARAQLEAYRWPGNVRQLKNVIEQLALFEADKPIERDVLSSYLPDLFCTPAVVGAPAAQSTAGNEAYVRELFNMVRSLQLEVESLRSQLNSQASSTIAPQHISLPQANFTDYREVEPIELNQVVEVLDSPVTLEQNERELIRQSLERNAGRRKAAAKELNISERTLYRKIKDYDLE